MTSHAMRFLVCLLLPGLAGTAWAGGTVSPRLQRTEAALRTWMEAGGQGAPPVPVHVRNAIRNLPPEGVAWAPGQDLELGVLVLTSEAAALVADGFAVGTIAGEVATVTVPLSRLNELGTLRGVRWVELSKPLRPLLDVSVPEIRGDLVHGAGQPPYPGSTGDGVVVGIVDTGIDYDHPDFRRDDNTSRITRIWDQTDLIGPNPSGYNYGTEWTVSSIQAGTARQRDRDGHGTHVAGIAAGNGRGAPSQPTQYTFVGAAPEAEILFVKTNFNESGLIDAIAWIQNRAGTKPSVINLSLGSQFGPHDGTSILDQAMTGLTGPKRILVAAAGNEGGRDLHAEANVSSGATVQISFQIAGYTQNPGSGNDFLYIDGWSPSNANFSVSVITPTNVTVGPITTAQTSVNTVDGTVALSQGVGAENGDRNLLIDITDDAGVMPKAGTWRVQLHNNAGGAREMDLWLSYLGLDGGSDVEWTSHQDNTELIASPSSSDSVISVGAYVTKTSWDCIAETNPCGYVSPPAIGSAPSFSSPGPLRDGTPKPDIAAPGMGIASSLSTDAESGLFTDPYAILTGAYHYVSQGTSQASPHVAGGVALLLENRPNLGVKDVRNAIILSARHDGFTGGGYNAQFGNGKFDVAAALGLLTPVRLLSLDAGWEDDHAVIRWELSETEEGAFFRVERGADRLGPFTAVSPVLDGGLSLAWTDPEPDPNRPWYRVVATTRDGSSQVLGTVRLDPAALRLRLWPNAPNPFAASTAIAFELDRPGDARLDVLDVSGRSVAVLAAGSLPAGRHEVTWDGTLPGGGQAGSGIYFLRLRAPGGAVLAQRMVLAR